MGVQLLIQFQLNLSNFKSFVGSVLCSLSCCQLFADHVFKFHYSLCKFFHHTQDLFCNFFLFIIFFMTFVRFMAKPAILVLTGIIIFAHLHCFCMFTPFMLHELTFVSKNLFINITFNFMFGSPELSLFTSHI